MGKTKLKTIDDSAPVEKPKKQLAKKPVKQEEDALVAKLKAELGIAEEERAKAEEASKSEPVKTAAGGAEERSRASTAASKASEDALEKLRRQDPQRRDEQASGTTDRRRKKPQQQVLPKKQRSKKYQQALGKIDKNQAYPLSQAVKLAKDVSYSQFGGSLEVHINTNQKNIRGLINLPHLSGKKLTILAFGKGAKEAGTDLVGDDSTLTEIEQSKINFDILVTTPEWMPKIAKLAKVLGPKGLMPNPKNNTVTADLKKVITELQSGKTEYKTDKDAQVMHLGVGKLNQGDQELEQNIKVLLTTIGKSKITKAVLAPTMGPSVKLDLSTI